MTGRNPRAQCERCGDPVVGRGLCSYHYESLRRYQQATGTFETQIIPIGPVLDHFNALRAAGIGLPRLAELAGLHRMTVDHLGDAGRKYVNRRTADAILAISLPTSPVDSRLADGARVPSLGSTRRVRALARAGWSRSYVITELGAGDPKSLPMARLYQARQANVTARRARDIDALYRRLEVSTGPDERSKRYAAEQGWPPPWAWDLETIDDPDTAPADLSVPVLPSKLTTEEFVDLARDYREHAGRTDADIAAVLGVEVDTVQARIRRAEKRAS